MNIHLNYTLTLFFKYRSLSLWHNIRPFLTLWNNVSPKSPWLCRHLSSSFITQPEQVTGKWPRLHTDERAHTHTHTSHTYRQTHKLLHAHVHKHGINSHKSMIHLSQTMDTLEHMLKKRVCSHSHIDTQRNAHTPHSSSYHIRYRWALLLLSPKWI